VNKLEQEEIVLSVDLCKFHAGDRVPRDAFWRPRSVLGGLIFRGRSRKSEEAEGGAGGTCFC